MTSKRKHDGREIYTRTVAGRDHVHHQNRAAFVHGGMGNITNIREIRVHQNFAAFVHGGMGNITNNNEERPELQEVCYKMDSAPRGLCYIFNNKHFEGRSPRFGTDKDRDGLKEVWEKLQFVVTTFDDFKTHEMEEKLLELSKLEVSENCDCLVVIFLTYGKKGAVQGTDNEWLTVNSITSPFKIGRCPSLTGKPKLFFFQSFRGGKNQTVQMDGGDTVEVMNKLTEADFFLGFATVVGTVSLRDVENGSWFIQEMIQTLQKSANSILSSSLFEARNIQTRFCKPSSSARNPPMKRKFPYPGVNQMDRIAYIAEKEILKRDLAICNLQLIEKAEIMCGKV